MFAGAEQHFLQEFKMKEFVIKLFPLEAQQHAVCAYSLLIILAARGSRAGGLAHCLSLKGVCSFQSHYRKEESPNSNCI